MLSNAFVANRLDNAHPQSSNANDNGRTDVARWDRVVCAVDLDMAVVMCASFQRTIVFKACSGQWCKKRPFFLEHFAYLPFGRSMDPRCCPTVVPVKQMRVLFVDGLEATPSKSGPLRVTNCGFDLPL